MKTQTVTQFKLAKLKAHKAQNKATTNVEVKPLTKLGIINVKTQEIIAYIPDFAPDGTAEGLLAILNSNRTIALPERD